MPRTTLYQKAENRRPVFQNSNYTLQCIDVTKGLIDKKSNSVRRSKFGNQFSVAYTSPACATRFILQKSLDARAYFFILLRSVFSKTTKYMGPYGERLPSEMHDQSLRNNKQPSTQPRLSVDFHTRRGRYQINKTQILKVHQPNIT